MKPSSAHSRVSKDELIEKVWDARIVSDGTLNTRINSVRRAVCDDGKRQAVIKTFPRRGFRFVAALRGESDAPIGPPATVASDKPSIAVLPFDNLSGDPEQEYFSDGIAEDITTALSRLRWLSVISRNTMFTFKGQAVEVQAVAKELNVRYVLEGSVRKAASRVRISVQLVDGGNGSQLWPTDMTGSLRTYSRSRTKLQPAWPGRFNRNWAFRSRAASGTSRPTVLMRGRPINGASRC